MKQELLAKLHTFQTHIEVGYTKTSLDDDRKELADIVTWVEAQPEYTPLSAKVELLTMLEAYHEGTEDDVELKKILEFVYNCVEDNEPELLKLEQRNKNQYHLLQPSQKDYVALYEKYKQLEHNNSNLSERVVNLTELVAQKEEGIAVKDTLITAMRNEVKAKDDIISQLFEQREETHKDNVEMQRKIELLEPALIDANTKLNKLVDDYRFLENKYRVLEKDRNLKEQMLKDAKNHNTEHLITIEQLKRQLDSKVVEQVPNRVTIDLDKSTRFTLTIESGDIEVHGPDTVIDGPLVTEQQLKEVVERGMDDLNEVKFQLERANDRLRYQDRIIDEQAELIAKIVLWLRIPLPTVKEETQRDTDRTNKG